MTDRAPAVVWLATLGISVSLLVIQATGEKIAKNNVLVKMVNQHVIMKAEFASASPVGEDITVIFPVFLGISVKVAARRVNAVVASRVTIFPVAVSVQLAVPVMAASQFAPKAALE